MSVLGHDPQQRSHELRERMGIVLQSTGHVPAHRGARGDRALGPLLPRSARRGRGPRSRGAEEKADAYARTLSGGQLRRLDFALALVGDPELIFLDEPTTGFDPAARRAAWDVVRSLQDLGKTVLLTTHYLDEAQALCDRVAIVKEGRFVAEGAARLARRRLGALPRDLARRERRDRHARDRGPDRAAAPADERRARPRRVAARPVGHAPDARGRLPRADRRGAQARPAPSPRRRRPVTDAAVLAWHQYRLERRMFWRNPSAAFFNFFLPLLFLALFGAIFGGNQDNLDVIVPGIAGMSRHVDDVQRARDEHHVPARAGRAQADARDAAAEPAPTSSGIAGQRGDERGDPDHPRRPRRARCSSASGGRRTGSSSSCSSSAGVVCLASLGVAWSHVIPNFDAAPAYVNIVFLPVIFISGVFYDVDNTPAFLRDIAQALPLTHIIDGLQRRDGHGRAGSRTTSARSASSSCGPSPGSCSRCAGSAGSRGATRRAS